MYRRLVLLLIACLSAIAAGSSFALIAPASAKTPPAPLSLEQVLARHHDALGRLPALVAHWSGSISEDAQQTHYEITAARDGRFRQLFKFALSERSQGSNGVVDWLQDENGNVQLVPAEHHVSMDARLVRLNDLRVDAQHAVLSGINDVDGHRAYAVNTIVDGKLSVMYIDADSWLVDGADFGERSIRYHSYHRFQGVPVPSSITETNGSTTATITVDACSFRGVRDDFNPPAQKRPQFPAGIREVALSFDSPKGLIVVAASINDHPVHLLIDSGSTTSVIDSDLAKRLNLATGGIARVQGAGMLTGAVARVDSLNIGGMRFAPFYMEAVPLRLPGPISREGIDGVLGYDLLAPLVMRISYHHSELRFMFPESFNYAGNGSVLSIDTVKRVPLMSASLGKDDRGIFTVDTGSDARLVLYRAFADANRRDFVDPWNNNQDFGAGAGGDFPTRIATVSRLNLGAYSLTNLITEVILRESGAFGSSSSDGIVGSGSLGLFDAVFFDYPNKRIILER